MIINKQHEFAFVHIPKCAGTSVRKPLERFESSSGIFNAHVGDHPTLGKVDYVHIPLFTLHDYFPREFQAVREYWSFVVMRDPFERFASSISQRLKMYSDKPIQRHSLDEIREAIDESISYLSSRPRNNYLLPPQYIHFQRQVDYIQLDGAFIVDKIYLVDEVQALLIEVGNRVGQDLQTNLTEGIQSTHANRTVVFRSDFLGRVIETSRPLTNWLSQILSERTKQRIRKRIYVPRDQRLKSLFAAEHVRAFIKDYYASDISLYQKVRQKRSGCLS